MIKKISDEKREQIANASAKTLPNNPTGRGMTPDEIRSRFWKPIIASGKSLADEINRVVGEANTDIDNAVAKAENELSIEKKERKAADSEHGTMIVDAVGRIVELESEVDVGNGNSELIKYIDVGVDILDQKIAENKAAADDAYAPKLSTEAAFGALFSAVDGLTNNYVADDVNAIQGFLDNGYWEIAGATYYAERMKTGDNIFVVDSGCPDFWFEKTSDMGRIPEKITITLDDESTVTLTLRVYFNGNLVGLLHILESDNVNLGDLDRVLDSIIAYQERLIGGDA